VVCFFALREGTSWNPGDIGAMAAIVTVQAPVTLSLQGLIEGEREISSARWCALNCDKNLRCGKKRKLSPHSLLRFPIHASVTKGPQ
jgi:hypothetical protein